MPLFALMLFYPFQKGRFQMAYGTGISWESSFIEKCFMAKRLPVKPPIHFLLPDNFEVDGSKGSRESTALGSREEQKELLWEIK